MYKMTRYTVSLFINGEIIDYLNTDNWDLAHKIERELTNKHGKDNVSLCDAEIEWMVG